MPEFKQKNYVKSQTSPKKETSLQVSGSSTEPHLENQTANTPVHCLNDSNKQHHQNQRNETNMTANITGNDNICLPKITSSQTEERPVKDEITNEIYMPLSSTIVLKRKEEMLYVPPDSGNSSTIDVLVDSRASVSEISLSELDRIKQQAPTSLFKIDDLRFFKFK